MHDTHHDHVQLLGCKQPSTAIIETSNGKCKDQRTLHDWLLGLLTGVVAHMTGAAIRMPARGSVTIASLPHVAPHVRWFSGVVTADFDPSPATPLGAFWQVTLFASEKSATMTCDSRSATVSAACGGCKS